ncbi:alpha/beta hydrolase [Candidatus Gottesmanbacteria bacterium]|nr:alpha/beta hydrolase [Candidatus Gottesmanbacteria bacterium]
MNFTSKIVNIDHLHFHLVTGGTGKPVVLIHGLTNNWEGHIPLATALGKTFKVYIPDMPGYGDSGRLKRYNIEQMSKSLYALVQKLGIKPLAVMGLSMGGFIAADFAKSYTQATESAIIMGPVLRDKHRGVNAAKYFFKSTKIVPGGRTILKKIVETKSIAYLFAKYVNMYRFNKELIDKYGMNGKKKMTKDAYVEMGIAAAEYDFDATLRTIRTPTLLVYGREDKMSSFTYAQKFVLPGNPHLDLAVILEAGHIVSLEKPRETARAITSFLNQLK